jgi:predicted permease
MRTRTFDTLFLDLRYAFRALRRDATFAAFAILIIALGIGASCTVFSVVNAVLVRPLPFRDPERLVWIANHDSSGLSGQTTQVGHLLDLRERNRSFEDLGAYFAFYGAGDNLLSGQGEPERLSGVPVSENFFRVLGVTPQIGRVFNADECKWHGPAAVMLGHGAWERRFASDPGIVGRALIINNKPVTVVGVLPASFDFASVFVPGSHIDLYFPFPLSPETNRWGNTMAIVGRLKRGVPVQQARAELKILAGQITQAHPERNTFEGFVTPLSEHVSGRLRLPLVVLACAVGVVMLIVCANLSNLMLARTAARQKEVAIRAALGAGRRRLVQQMLTEGVALSSCGAALGALLAFGGTRLVSHLDSMGIPLLQNVRTDLRALAFALVAALATGIIFGLAPALQASGIAVHEGLKDNARGSTGGRGHNWLRSALVVTEIAFACVLLVGAGLLIRSFLHVLDVNLGFQPERAVAVRVDPDSRIANKDLPAYFSEVLRRAMSVPGVEAAGLSDALPLGRNRSWGVPAKGRTYPKGQFPDAFVRVVSGGYIAAMGIPLREGRDFDDRDGPDTDRVALVNETMARRMFPGESALGKEIRTCSPGYAAYARIVGVVGDVRHLALEQGSGMEMYMSIRQCRDFSSVDLVVRTNRTAAQVAPAMRAALKPIAPNLPGNDFRVLQALVNKAVSPRRFVVWLLGGFAAFALLLASLGIYGVVSYAVSQRTQEIGIRMALGASGTKLQAGIVGRTLSLAAIGMALGAAASWAAARALGGMLFGITPADPVTFAGMLAILTAVAAAASYLPARRASSIDPAIALRSV